VLREEVETQSWKRRFEDWSWSLRRLRVHESLALFDNALSLSLSLLLDEMKQEDRHGGCEFEEKNPWILGFWFSFFAISYLPRWREHGVEGISVSCRCRQVLRVSDSVLSFPLLHFKKHFFRVCSLCRSRALSADNVPKRSLAFPPCELRQSPFPMKNRKEPQHHFHS